MRSRPRRARRAPRRQHAGLAAALVAIILVATFATLSGADNQIPDPGWQVTPTSPNTGLVDGQRVTINVRSRMDVSVGLIEVRQCRAGVSFQVEADMNPTNGNCPAGPISSSQTEHVLRRSGSDGLTKLARTNEGATFTYRVGAGVTAWDTPSGSKTLTCGPADSCLLVVKLLIGAETRFWTQPLTFLDADPLASCGGVADGVVATAGSDEMSDAWAAWTRDFCASKGTTSPTRAAFPGEGEALVGVGGLTGFTTTDPDDRSYAYDLVYTASGYNDAAKLLGNLEPSKRRGAVAIPVAVNAAVLAVGGGYLPLVDGQPIGDKAPYPELRVKAAEAASMLSGGISRLGSSNFPYAAGVLGRNPVLGPSLYYLGAGIQAPSLALTSTWAMTSYLKALAPDDFVAPRENPQVPRPATSRIGTANPGYAPDVIPYTGRPTLFKTTEAAALAAEPGPVWVFTDLATAKATGLTPVALENADHEFVGPSVQSLGAAIDRMQPDGNGILAIDPKLVNAPAAPAESITPYPLTYVVYALVPAEPLVRVSDCTLRTSSQQLLGDWLQYVMGPGQQKLPAGLQPLPPSLAEQARTRLAQVGASAVTGECAGKVKTPTSPTAPSSTGGDPPVTTPSIPSIPSFPIGNFPSTFTTPTVPPVTVAGTTTTRPEVEIASVPAFAGRDLPDSTDGVVALVGIALVTSLALSITSRAGGARRARAMTGSGGFYSPAAQQRVFGLVLLWVGVLLASAGLVVYQLAPLLQSRSQHDLLADYRDTLRSAAFADSGLPIGRSDTNERPPEVGEPVGILEIGSLRSQNVVVEGVGPSQTRDGPGHVPGTRGLGQPGNSVVVARRNSYGGPFAKIDTLRRGDRVVVTTTQGRSVYVVRSVRDVRIVDRATVRRNDVVARDVLFGSSARDRLTLVTSSSPLPWNEARATVVVADMDGTAFRATTQGALTTDHMTMDGDHGALSATVLALLVYAVAIGASVLVYRRLRFRVAYAITIAPIIAATVIVAETASHLLPSWA